MGQLQSLFLGGAFAAGLMAAPTDSEGAFQAPSEVGFGNGSCIASSRVPSGWRLAPPGSLAAQIELSAPGDLTPSSAQPFRAARLVRSDNPIHAMSFVPAKAVSTTVTEELARTAAPSRRAEPEDVDDLLAYRADDGVTVYRSPDATVTMECIPNPRGRAGYCVAVSRTAAPGYFLNLEFPIELRRDARRMIAEAADIARQTIRPC
jgi:hypothetical protein